MYLHFVGIDIAAATFTVAWLVKGLWHHATFEQRRTDYGRFAHQLREIAPPEQTLIVMEATGSYWLALAWFLYEASFAVSVINPSHAKWFARLEMQHAKTDRIDAQLLAEFARQRQPAQWTPPPAIVEQLQQRLTRRDDVLDIKTQEMNRLHALRQNPHADASILDRLERHIAYLQAEIDTLDRELADLLTGDHAWAAAARRLRTIPGIGLIAAAWILAATHCFAYCDTPEQAAAFAGLVPYRRESGSSRHGHRPVGRGGHAALRKTLYMATLAAARHNPCVKPLYDRLLMRGKPNKVARVASARKLMVIAWAVVVKERDFDTSFAPQPNLIAVGA
jgi:transposase